MLRRHSNALKPLLKAGNMTERLRWCLSMLDEDGLPNNPKFKCMDNIIHLDEKWFNMTKKARNFYLLPTEEDPYRTVQNKNFINKIMFLSAVSLPHYDADGNCTFDGKIGVWPFVRKVPQHFLVFFEHCSTLFEHCKSNLFVLKQCRSLRKGQAGTEQEEPL